MRYFIIILSVIGFLVACQKPSKEQTVIEEINLGGNLELDMPKKLSEWNLFELPLKSLTPKPGIFPYDLNTPLFSDYALKARFIKLPEGKQAQYHATEVMDFPKGTILIKNFYYPDDFRDLESKLRIIETRLLIHKEEGWSALTYVWNEGQTDALLEIAGKSVPVSWIDKAGILQNINYSVPNLVQCKSCHEKSGKLLPIGPTARQLNRTYSYTEGDAHQLSKWKATGMLAALPPEEEWPVVPVWDDPATGALDQRARAWLEINCAHCHRSEGPAKNTGLYLTYDETDSYKLGVNKPPVAAGKGSGGLKYSIVPGKPEESILVHRIESLDPGVMMPEVGRKVRHEEGIELIREWIAGMGRK